MSLSRDMSIRQQLGLGLALLIVILAGLLGAVLHFQGKSRGAARTFIEEVEPRRAQAEQLQRAIMGVGLDLRSYLLHGDDLHLSQVRTSTERARAVTERLALGETDEGALRKRVSDYLQEVDGVVKERVSAPVSLDEEVRLANLREGLVQDIRHVVHQEEQRARAALTGMSQAREEVRRGVLLACGVALFGFLIVSRWIIRSVSDSTRDIVQVAGNLAAGDWKPALRWAVPPSQKGKATSESEMRQIARALGAAAWCLEQREGRLVAEGEVARIAASSLDAAALGASSLNAVIEHVGADLGAVYLREEDGDNLIVSATHALESGAMPLRMGEGIPGQAARERRTLVVRDIPQDSAFRVKLGYDEAPPRTVAAVPIEAHGRLYGVMVVASLRDLDDEAVSFLERSAGQLAMGVANAKAHETAQNLLTDLRERNILVQAQNEELQAQNEEIQSQAEELHAQTEELQTQSEQLQVQQEEIQAQNDELKQRAEELELQAGRLREADERKTEFLGVLAHELRNPLAAIVNGLFLLRRVGAEGEQGQRAVSVIDRQTQHLARLIDDLLDVARIARGKVRLERAPLDMAQLVRSCIEDQRATIEQKDLKLELELPAEPAMVEGDRTRLYQVVDNLLSNAIKFTDSGGRISVELSCHDEEITLRVADTGVGIEATLLDQLFTPFSQGSNGLARTNGGLGLGLALVKSLLGLHGGTVEAFSEGVGQGAEFVVRLPRINDVELPEQGVSHAARARSTRILIVEDSRDAADTLRDALEFEGHRVAVARTGTEGVRCALEFGPQIVLCDLGLPGVDGYEVARRLRSDSRFAETFLVAVSGYASETDKQRATAAGFDIHQAKPLQVERILELIASCKQGNSKPS